MQQKSIFKLLIIIYICIFIVVINVNISFVDEVQHTVRYLICKSNITMASAVICGAFPLIHVSNCNIAYLSKFNYLHMYIDKI